METDQRRATDHIPGKSGQYGRKRPYKRPLRNGPYAGMESPEVSVVLSGMSTMEQVGRERWLRRVSAA